MANSKPRKAPVEFSPGPLPAGRRRLRRGPGLPSAGDQGAGNLERSGGRHRGPAQQDRPRSGGTGGLVARL